jgi:hypothetical protein
MKMQSKKSLLPLNPLKGTLVTAVLRAVLRQSLPFTPKSPEGDFSDYGFEGCTAAKSPLQGRFRGVGTRFFFLALSLT